MRGGAATPTPSADLCELQTRDQDLFSGLGCPVFNGVFLQAGKCGEVLIGRICPRCKKQFWICRHCDRGHVYCTFYCSTVARAEKCKVYRKQYRQSLEGRLDHRDTERVRRQRKAVGDQTSLFSGKTARVSAPMRLSAWFAAMRGVGGKDTNDGEICCSICGRSGNFGQFTDFGGGERSLGKGYRLRM